MSAPPPEPPDLPRLILCADDFAHSTGTSRVIARLLRERRLSATGCMTLMPNWRADAAMLADLPPDRQVGLHLVLTEEAPLTAMRGLAPAGRLPDRRTLERGIGRLPLAEIAAEIDAQFDSFAQRLGRPPAFVDGHQHTHAMPGIRDIVITATRAHAPGAWLRECTDAASAILARPWRGKAIRSAGGSRGLAAAARAGGLATNRGFAGHYGFAGDYHTIFPAFLRRPGARHLVMCHPGADTRAGDAIARARVAEAAALAVLPIRDLAAARGLAF